ncbi:MAG: hypothetical protein JOS17DRAFT_750381 [Linnemannia elongata]|nr:MAG: hypothetical protein JOS17DRAFT_750381 [Linnemannia elongata]
MPQCQQKQWTRYGCNSYFFFLPLLLRDGWTSLTFCSRDVTQSHSFASPPCQPFSAFLIIIALLGFMQLLRLASNHFKPTLSAME